jgi:hypothetical protein
MHDSGVQGVLLLSCTRTQQNGTAIDDFDSPTTLFSDLRLLSRLFSGF